MKEELKKSLTDLIDETLLELEELKKSRFAAAEVKIEGPGEGIAGKPSDGDLHAKKADDKDEDDEDEDDEKEEAKEAKKADEGDPADKPEVGRKLKELTEKAEGVNEEKPVKKSDEKSPEQADKQVQEMARKSDAEMETLMKSFVEERVKPLEDKLSTILAVVNKIAEQPVPPKGTTANAVPLLKSTEEASEALSKSDIASKLFELKKSGTKVDSLDITRAEMGHDLQKIVDKYKIS
jgi:hypothetical protein